ncbi:MAG: hypothetical protein V3T22_14230 [Planctomycetota bacterium]
MEAELGRLHGYLGVILARGAQRAGHMHADELTLAHVLGACMCDEDCAAHEVVVHAFADPETIELELTALSPGILVVGSRAALPFSTLAVEALAQARDAARGAGEEEQVETSMLLSSALDYLPPELSEPWIAGGSRAAGDREPGGRAVAASDVATGEPLFRRFSPDAKRALSLACKAAHAHGERSISPARLVLACLDAQPGVGRSLSPPLSPSSARSHLAGHTVDETPPPQRVLPPHPQLLAVLRELPQGGDSLDLLARAGRQGDEALDTLMDRHRLTPLLLQRARAAFRDPDPGTHERASS